MTDRQITHGPGCWDWGPRHYECALQEIKLMTAAWERVFAAKVEAEARAERLAELKRFIELELAKIEPQWIAEGKGSYWWGVKIGLETVLKKLCEMDGTVMVERLKSMTAVTMGVGSGGGNLFVHGDYDSIKAAQAIVLERDTLRRALEEREQRDEALLRQALEALELGAWDTRKNAAAAIRERLEGSKT